MTAYEPESEFLLTLPYFFTRGNQRGCTNGTGAYVDLGCAHPVNHSLTAFVRDLGWRGLAVDGNPDHAFDWQQAGFGDHFIPAILSDQPRARFAIHENALTSRISPSPETDHRERWGIARIIEQQTVPLNDLLELAHIGEIDLLTVDLEGYEAAVLRTLDFEKHRPRYIIAEYVAASEDPDPEACNFLLSLGYEVLHMTASNLIYRRKEVNRESLKRMVEGIPPEELAKCGIV
jgi:FkbM family methyltransferase